MSISPNLTSCNTSAIKEAIANESRMLRFWARNADTVGRFLDRAIDPMMAMYHEITENDAPELEMLLEQFWNDNHSGNEHHPNHSRSGLRILRGYAAGH